VIENRIVLLTLNLPDFDSPEAAIAIVKFHVAEGDAVRPGSPLFDVRVQLTEGIAWDCPPISHYRVLSSEQAWVRHVAVARNVDTAIGTTVMMLSTEVGESLEAAATRVLRTATVSILQDPDWWSEG
jgi:hypothetical protein